MRKVHLLKSGLPPLAATNIAGAVVAGQTATGTTQADAFILAADLTVFSTVASGSGARLPAVAEAGDFSEVYNGGANALLVYPPVGGTINALAANAGYSLATGKFCTFKCTDGTMWVTNLSA